MPGALDGVKVLEIAQVMAIPICGVLLSDMGADVVKLEPPWGDASRYTMQPVFPGESKSFAVLNRGKRSVCLNIADKRCRPALEALMRWADVVLVSVKGEDLNSYRMGYDDLSPLNPQMIYLEHVPLGRTGPMGGLGSYDLVVTESGAVYVTDNGANGGWGGYPMNEGLSGSTSNDYRPGEPGSNGPDPVFGDPQVNKK